MYTLRFYSQHCMYFYPLPGQSHDGQVDKSQTKDKKYS